MTSADPADAPRATRRRRGSRFRRALRHRAYGVRRFILRHAVAIGVIVIAAAVTLGGLAAEGFLSPPPGSDIPEPVSLPRPVIATPQGTATARPATPRVHRLELRVTAAGPIGRVGYLVPSGLRSTSGITIVHRSTWSLRERATAAGRVAEIFIQTDASGRRMTCSISVDGTLRVRRTVSTPYARTVCIG